MMESESIQKLELCMEAPWYKELWTFLMVPFMATGVCYLVPFFHCEQGMTFMAFLPLTSVCSYGHILSPRRPYYESGWKERMGYDDFILGSVKRTLFFAFPVGLSAWIISLILNGYLRELAIFFETTIWGIGGMVMLFAVTSHIGEMRKLKSSHPDNYDASVRNLYRWFLLPTVVLFSLEFWKIWILFDILSGRPRGI